MSAETGESPSNSKHDWKTLYGELQGESERAAAIVGAAMLDDLLGQVIILTACRTRAAAAAEPIRYAPYTVSKGFAWYAKGTASGLDPKTRKVVTLVETALYYVLPGSAGQATVTATVGRGDFATAIKAP